MVPDDAASKPPARKEGLAISNSIMAPVASLWRAEGRFSQKLWSFADQGLVSAANFFVLFFLARNSNAADVGYYAVAISVVVIMIGIQDALITRPYTLRFFDSGQTAEEHAGGSLFLAAAMAVTAGLVAGAAALAIHFLSHASGISLLLAALAIALPFALLREFIRRYLLASMSVREVFFFDCMAIATMVILLLLLADNDRLEAASALGAMGFAYLVTFAIWFFSRLKRFRVSRESIRQSTRTCWGIGKWLLPGRAAREVQGYMTHWYSIVMLSASATGVFAASLSILALSNPFVIGMLNVMTPRAVRALRQGGIRGLRDQTILDTLVIGLMMFGFTGIIVLFGDAIMALLFPGEAYADNSGVLAVLAIAIAIAATGGPAAIALMITGNARTESKISLGTCALAFLLIPVLILTGGLFGAAFALLIGEIAGFIARWGLFAALLTRGGAGLSRAAIVGSIAGAQQREGGDDNA